MESNTKAERKDYRKCYLCKDRYSGGRPLFAVPKDEESRQEWEDACKLTFPKKARVCPLHFNEEDFCPIKIGKQRRLDRFAVPSKMLPLSDNEELNPGIFVSFLKPVPTDPVPPPDIVRQRKHQDPKNNNLLKPTLESTGTNTDEIASIDSEVQTDIVCVDKRTCGLVCISKTSNTLCFFLCCLFCSEQYALSDWAQFGKHMCTGHTYEEQLEGDWEVHANWPVADDAKAVLIPRRNEQQMTITEDSLMCTEKLDPSLETELHLSQKVPQIISENVVMDKNLQIKNVGYSIMDENNENIRLQHVEQNENENIENSTQNADIEKKPVKETTPPIEYDELPFTDNETDSDSESELNPLKLDHCYTQPLINKIKTFRSSILKELVEVLVNFPPLWYLRKVSESAYDSSIKTLCKLLNCRWAINLSEENLIRTVEGIKTWYRSLIMYTHVKTVTEAVICSDEYFKYYLYCAQYLPPTEEGHPPPVECPECHENVGDYANLYVHCIEQHGIYRSSPYTCELCRRQFRSIEAADAHFKLNPNHLVLPRPLVVKYTNIVSRRPTSCPKCNQHFYHQEVYDFHLHQHKNPPKPFVCEVCDERFAIESSYALHRNREHNMSCFVCEICNKEYEKGTPYNVHMKKHRGEYDFMCHVCGMMFLHKPNLWQHLECSHGTRANCNICNISFVGLSPLQKHQRTFHLVLEGTNEDLEIQRMEKRSVWKRKVRKVRKHNSHVVWKYSGRGPPRKYERVNEDKEAKTFSLKCPMCDKIYRQYMQLYSHLQKIHNHDPRKTNIYIEQPMVAKISKPNRKPYLNKRSTCNYTYPEQKHTIDYLKIPIALPSESVSVKKPAIDTEAETAEENELLDGVVVIDDQILVQPNIRNQCRSDEEPMETMDEIVDDTRLPQISAQQTDDNGTSELRDSLMNDDEAMEAANEIVPAMKASDNSSNKTPKLSRLNVDLLATPMNVLSMPLLQSPEREPEGISRLASMRADTLFSHDIDEAEFQVLMHIDDLDDT